MSLINCQFRLRTPPATHSSDVMLKRATLPCVMNVGELVNIDGDPYRVIEREWAVDDGDRVYCYMYVIASR